MDSVGFSAFIAALVVLAFCIFVFSEVGSTIDRSHSKTSTVPKRMPAPLSPRSNRPDFGPFDRLEARIIRDSDPDRSDSVVTFWVEVRGRLSHVSQLSATAVTSLIDVEGTLRRPITTDLRTLQEANSRVFQGRVGLGYLSEEAYLADWSPIAFFYPDTLTGPFSGLRMLTAIVRIVPDYYVDEIHLGLHKASTRILAFAEGTAWIDLEQVGYIEACERHEKALEIILKAAVAMAAADRGIEAKEAATIQRWMRYQVSSASEDTQDRIKELLNAAFRRAHAEALNGTLLIGPLIDKLASFDLPSANRQLLNLLAEVAGADSELAASELAMIRDIGTRLGVSHAEIDALSEARFLEAGVKIAAAVSGESRVGIDPSWSKDQIRTHLRKEFAKWNGRIQALSSDEERQKAQAMIDLIAELRQKYS